MKTIASIKNIFTLAWVIVLVAAGSCEKENVMHPTTAQTQAQAETTANDNSQIVAASQDIMDITAGGLAGQGVTNGRVSSYGAPIGPELECSPTISGSFKIDRSSADSVVYSGTLTIDYGDGTSCKDSTEMHKGKIVDSFVFIRRFKDSVSYDLTETVTFAGFQRDTVLIDGTFIGKSSSSLVSTLMIQNAKITYPSKQFVAWSGNLTNTFTRSNSDWGKQGGSTQVTGSLNGTDRSGNAFSAVITKAILFDYSCSRSIPVSGTIEVNVGGTTSDVNYGPGTCDRTYTITTEGKVTEYTFKKHHNINS